MRYPVTRTQKCLQKHENKAAHSVTVGNCAVGTTGWQVGGKNNNLLNKSAALSLCIVLSLVSGFLVIGADGSAWADPNNSPAPEAIGTIDNPVEEDSMTGSNGVDDFGESSYPGHVEDQAQSDESGLPTSPIGQPAPGPVSTESERPALVEEPIVSQDSPSIFGIVTQGTWQGVTWKLTNDKGGVSDYELHLGNPDGVTPEAFPLGVMLTNAPWYTTNNYKINIVEINIVGPVITPRNLAQSFQGFAKLAVWNDESSVPGVPFWDTSNATNMSGMFYGSPNLNNTGGMAGWNTSNVLSMGSMFGSTGITNVDGLADWDVQNVSDMEGMFANCTSLVEVDGLTGWQTDSLIKMFALFRYCASLTNIDGLAGWNTSNVTSEMRYVFEGCTSLVNVDGMNGWDTSNVTSMAALFRSSGISNIDGLYGLDISQVTDMSGMFAYCANLKVIDTSSWTGNINTANISTMFQNSGVERLDLSAIKTQGTTWPRYSQHTFKNCYKLRVLTFGPNTNVNNETKPLETVDLPTPPYAESTGKWQTLGTSTNYKWPNGSWVGTSREVIYRLGTETYVWQPPLGFAEVPEIFDFGKHMRPVGTNLLGLSTGAYTPAEVVNGFDLVVGSNAIHPWHVTAELGVFTNLDGGTTPSGVELQVSGMSLSRVDGAPAPGINPSLNATQMTLNAGGSPVKIVSATSNTGGIGEWGVNMPFNNIKLQVPPLSQTDMGMWESQITWSLDNTP